MITTCLAVVIVLIVLVNATHGWFAIPAGLALAGYAGYRVRSRRRGLLAGRPAVQPAGGFGAAFRFNPPPGWPVPRLGWTPPPGWQPGPSWPQPPPGWQFWVPDGQAPTGERNTRSRSPGRQDRRRGQGRRPVPSVRLRHGTALRPRHPVEQGRRQYRGEHPVALRPVQPAQGRRRHLRRHLASPATARQALPPGSGRPAPASTVGHQLS